MSLLAVNPMISDMFLISEKGVGEMDSIYP